MKTNNKNKDNPHDSIPNNSQQPSPILSSSQYLTSDPQLNQFISSHSNFKYYNPRTIQLRTQALIRTRQLFESSNYNNSFSDKYKQIFSTQWQSFMCIQRQIFQQHNELNIFYNDFYYTAQQAWKLVQVDLLKLLSKINKKKLHRNVIVKFKQEQQKDIQNIPETKVKNIQNKQTKISYTKNNNKNNQLGIIR